MDFVISIIAADGVVATISVNGVLTAIGFDRVSLICSVQNFGLRCAIDLGLQNSFRTTFGAARRAAKKITRHVSVTVIFG